MKNGGIIKDVLQPYNWLHAIVLELNVESYRIATAKLRKQKTAKQIEI